MKKKMGLTFYLPAIVTILYIGTGVAFLIKGDCPKAGIWIFYALANVCLIMDQMR